MFSVEDFVESSGLDLVKSGQHSALVSCPSERLEETLVYLRNHLGFSLLSGINCENENGHVRVYYWLDRIESGFGLGLVIDLEDNEKLSSVSPLYANARGLESELVQKIGDRLRTPFKLLSERRFEENPKRVSVEASYVDESVREKLWLKGPLNPGGELGANVISRDDIVEDCQIFTGQFGRNLQNRMIGKNAGELADNLLKFDGSDGFNWSFLAYKALEEGSSVEVPDKAKAIRMIFSEFSRITSHLEFCAKIAYEMEANSAYYELLEWLARIGKLQRLYTGNMHNLGILTFGGAHREPPSNWISICLNELLSFQGKIRNAMEKVSASSLWRQCDEIGAVESKTLISWGIAGPTLRASGINFDMRKRKPFYLYDEVDFEVPIGINGTLFDRILVRLEEVFQSMGIIAQLLDNLPTGALVSQEVQHFSRIDLAQENAESIYRESVESGVKLGDGLFQDSMEISSGLVSLCVRFNESKVSDLYIGSNCHGKVLCLESMAKGCSFENLPLLLKSIHLNLRTLEK